MWEDRAEHQVRVDLLIGGFACFCIGLGLVSISWLISLGDFPDFKFTQCWVAEVTAQEYLPDTNLQVIQLTTETDEKLQYSVTTLCAEEENCLATVNISRHEVNLCVFQSGKLLLVHDSSIPFSEPIINQNYQQYLYYSSNWVWFVWMFQIVSVVSSPVCVCSGIALMFEALTGRVVSSFRSLNCEVEMIGSKVI
eukprot:c5531_g1_i2.p1 GENE.c5531_g1_i2~~c5531_g1_i2.p1  ORF type:complete len:195 (+),score=23.65 c5531_g1_i2:39-623(+)